MKCLFCNKVTSRPKYCSTQCIKRAYYVKNLGKNCRSYLVKNPNFWKSETGIGFKWEKYGARLLGAKHLKFNWNGADLDWGNKMVDVKSAELGKRKFAQSGTPIEKQWGTWTFNRGKLKPMDFFLCIALVKDKPVKILMIPANKFPKVGVCIGHNSKYDKYKISL